MVVLVSSSAVKLKSWLQEIYMCGVWKKDCSAASRTTYAPGAF